MMRFLDSSNAPTIAWMRHPRILGRCAKRRRCWLASDQDDQQAPASSVVYGSIEEVLRGVGHLSFFAGRAPGRAGSQATDGINPLNIGHSMENTGAFTGESLEQQPGNCSRIGCASCRTRSYDLAAAITFPGWADIVRSH